MKYRIKSLRELKESILGVPWYAANRPSPLDPDKPRRRIRRANRKPDSDGTWLDGPDHFAKSLRRTARIPDLPARRGL